MMIFGWISRILLFRKPKMIQMQDNIIIVNENEICENRRQSEDKQKL